MTMRPCAVAVLVLPLLLAGPSPVRAADTTDVIILYNGSVRAELNDCGCPKRPLGGLARRALVVDAITQGTPSPILLDAGSLFGDPTRDTWAQSGFVAGESIAMGYEVAGFGAYELGHGIVAVRAVATESGLGFVSANVHHDGELAFEPFRIIERDGVRVAVTSVLDPQFLRASFVKSTEDVEVSDPVEALRTVLPQMAARADAVIVLSNLRSGSLQQTLSALGPDATSSIDVVIDAVLDTAVEQPREVAGTLVVAANSGGKYLGQLTLTVDGGAVTAVDNLIHPIDIELPEAETVAARVAAFGTTTSGSR